MTSTAMIDKPDETPLELTLKWPVIRQSLIIMVVVGTLLNLINQGEAIMAWDGIDWMRACLTYLVPFFVSLFGAYSANRAICR